MKKPVSCIVAAAIVIGILLYGALSFNYIGSGHKEDRAKLDCKNLAYLVTKYFIDHGKFPENLEALAQPQPDGSPPLTSEQGLIDPWSRPYHYDPQQLHPKTGGPLIWSDGPNPGEVSSKISNRD